MSSHIRIQLSLFTQSIVFTSVVFEQKGYFFLGEICILYDAKIVIFDHSLSHMMLSSSIADHSDYITSWLNNSSLFVIL